MIIELSDESTSQSPTESEKLLCENREVTLNEYVWTHVKEKLERYGWIREPGPVPTSITPNPRDERAISEARRVVEDRLAMSNEAHRKEYDTACANRKALVERAQSLLAQINEWPGEEGDVFIQNSLQTELGALIESNRSTKETPEQYKRESIRTVIECADKIEKYSRRNLQTVQVINKSLAALRELVGDPPPVAAGGKG